MDKYSGYGAAEDGAAVDGAEDDKPRVGVHGEGQGQHERNAHCSREPRQAADDDAERNAAHHRKEIYPSQSANKALTH